MPAAGHFLPRAVQERATIRELKADYLRMAEHFGAARALKKPLDWNELTEAVSASLAASEV